MKNAENLTLDSCFIHPTFISTHTTFPWAHPLTSISECTSCQILLHRNTQSINKVVQIVTELHRSSKTRHYSCVTAELQVCEGTAEYIQSPV